jgi:hypothetical protein
LEIAFSLAVAGGAIVGRTAMNRQVPPALWVSLIAFGLLSAIQLVLSPERGFVVLLFSVALNVVLIVGLYRGAFWAFLLTLAFGIAGMLIGFAQGPAQGVFAVIGNGVVLVPMLLARAYFLEPSKAPSPGEIRYCPQCGRPTTAPPTPNCPVCNRT